MRVQGPRADRPGVAPLFQVAALPQPIPHHFVVNQFSRVRLPDAFLATPGDTHRGHPPAAVIWRMRLIQIRVLGPGSLQDGYVAFSVLPKHQEILVGGLCLGFVSRQSERTAEL
jgi:hypothetical protein